MFAADVNDLAVEGPMADDVLLQMITQNDQKHDEAHRRLRATLRDVEMRIESNYEYLKDGFLANKGRIEIIEKQAGAPVDVAKIVLTPRVVIGIVSVAIVIAGGFWASTAGLRSDLRDILTRMDAQKTAYEVQSGVLKTAVDDMKRRQELQAFEIQELKVAILKLSPGK